MPMKFLLISTFVIGTALFGFGAATAQVGEEAIQGSFKASDANSDGKIDSSELASYGESVFVSMDYDDNASISEEEFLNWGIDKDQFKETLRATFKVVFRLWDQDGDGSVTTEEFRSSMRHESIRADVDGNGSLNFDEYSNRMIIFLAIKAGLE